MKLFVLFCFVFLEQVFIVDRSKKNKLTPEENSAKLKSGTGPFNVTSESAGSD